MEDLREPVKQFRNQSYNYGHHIYFLQFGQIKLLLSKYWICLFKR